ncbi:MAG: heavy-metal-associated domain-containing protein [Thermoanaerobaculia bacterium]
MKKFLLLLLAFAVAWPLLAATKTVTFAVKGWTCGSCAAATRIALKKLDGIEDVKTDHEKMEAKVTYDDTKITPEKMIPAIEKLGYKATVKAAPQASAASPRSVKDNAINESALPERVSFFEVPLECGAAEGLGCGSASKPILRSLQRDARIAEPKINYPGTVLAVVWKDPGQARLGASAVEAAFKERDLETALLRGTARDKALKEFEAGQWYGASDVDRLSEREAKVIAARVVKRANGRLALPAERLAALTHDLSVGIARRLTRNTDEECARDPLEVELTKIAGKYLNEQQLAELRKAAEQGAGALPGETR